MTNHLRLQAAFERSGRSPWRTLLSGLLLVLVALHAVAQAPAAPAADPMDELVGRIALYPDDLVAVILPASTSPLQIVQADRWLEKRKSDPKLPMDDKWDDAVKTLLNYPTVVKMMSNDLDWTSALGEAVVADQGAVLDGVQSFRRRAQAAGNLKSDDKQVVKAEKEIIIIEPANPEVIYVPQYTPSTVVVYGTAPVYGYYPYAYPSYYYPYPPGAALATGLVWGAAIGAAWNGGRWGANYGGGDININRNTNVNVDRGGAGAAQRPAGGGSSSWKSGKQPGQVSSSVGKSPSAGARPGDSRGGASAGNLGSRGGASAGNLGSGGAGAAGGARPSTQPGGAGGAAGFGDRSSAQAGGRDAGGGASRPGTQPSGPSSRGGGDAFGGYSSGRQTQMDSSRGASSRSSMSGGGSRSMSGGGARGGGGGGRGGGGRR